MSAPNDCGHFLLALDVAHFRERAGFDADVGDLVRTVRGARRAPGVARLYVPGEREADAAERAGATGLELEGTVLDAVRDVAGELGVTAELAPIV